MSDKEVKKPFEKTPWETRQQAADYLLEGRKRVWIAEQCGVTRMALYNWMTKDQEFIDYIRKYTHAAAMAAQIETVNAVTTAVRNLHKALAEDIDGTLSFKVLEKTNTLAAAGRLLGQEPEKQEGGGGVNVVLNMSGVARSIDVETVD